MVLARAQPESLPSQETLDHLRQIYHLDDPVLVRYGHWLLRLCRWDLGESILDGRPVGPLLRATAFRTLILNLFALSFALALALPLGARWARAAGSMEERVGSLVLYLLYAFPAFAAALLLQQAFAVRWGLLPLQGVHDSAGALSWEQRGIDWASHLVLPVVCLTYGSLAYLTRFTRAGVLETLGSGYVAACRARGIRPRTLLWRHAFRNALLPLITLAGTLVPALLGGSVLVETVFSWPGMGRLYFDSLQNRDYPVVLAITVIAALLTAAGSLLADALFAWADPRIREASGAVGGNA
jgi:peptide/nickel transport system permease protein